MITSFIGQDVCILHHNIDSRGLYGQGSFVTIKNVVEKNDRVDIDTMLSALLMK